MRLTSCLRLMLVAAMPLFPAASHANNAWSHARSLTVVMVDNRFQPDHITLQAGQSYRLVLENHGKDMHEFTAPAFWKAATVQDKHLLTSDGTDVVVQAGKSVLILLIAPPKGRYDLRCADHDWDGMVGSITVN